MNYFLIAAGLFALVTALAAHDKANKLEKILKEKGIIEDGWEKNL